jgi:SAM-dependent methyltransferase
MTDEAGQRGSCAICGGATTVLGQKIGRMIQRPFVIRRCCVCLYAYVANPCADYAAIYDEAYYRGRGADPMVDYVTELDAPETSLRLHEWQGFLDLIAKIVGPLTGKKWLDFACGNGGLVRAGRQRSLDIVGFEEGWIADRARAAGIPLLLGHELDALEGTFDIVTAIEVVEHLIEPMAVFRRIRKLMKPGGLFYVITGNAKPFRSDLLAWRYVIPEIHVGFFEPDTLAEALIRTGFTPVWPGFQPPYIDIIRFRVLKNIGVRQRAAWQSLVPWALLSRIVDYMYGVSAHPAGIAQEA